MKFKEWRTEHGFTVKGMAEITGFHTSFIYAIQAGEKRPSYRNVDKFCEAMGVDPDEIEEFRPLDQRGPESLDPIGAALKAARRTRTDVCAKLGMTLPTLRAWRSGDATPWRDHLESFAQEVNAPWLLTAVPSKHRRRRMTCTTCGETTPVQHGILRGMLKRGIHQDAVFDEDGEFGTYTCNSCGRRKNITAVNGRKSNAKLQARGKRLFREYGRGSILNAIESSARARVGRPRPPEVRLKISITSTASLTEGNLYLCRECKTWGLSRRADGPRETHHPCLAQYRSKHPEMGLGAYPPPLNLDYPHGGTLVSMWELTWRHVVGGEPLTYTVKGKKSRSQLVAEFSLNQTDALDWIHFVLDHLAVDERGGKQITRRAKYLRWKAKAFGYVVESVELTAPPT